MSPQALHIGPETISAPPEEVEARLAVVKEAMLWLGTPYHHMAKVRGAGVDCAHLLIEVYHNAIGTPKVNPGFYQSGMALLKKGERMYLQIVASLAEQATPSREPLPGDIAVFRFVQATHAGIVLRWPLIIHAFLNAGRVVVSDAKMDAILGKRLHSIWVPKGWAVS